MNPIFFIIIYLEDKINPVYKDIIYFKIAYYFASHQLFPPVRQKALLLCWTYFSKTFFLKSCCFNCLPYQERN